MALDPSKSPSLTTFRALSFDIYGTLIDWRSAIHEQFQPVISQLPSSHPATESRDPLIAAFNRIEHELQEATPGRRYASILEQVYNRIASEWGVEATPGAAEAFGKAIGEWQPFPDTVEAMQTLGKHYKLIALSNIDNALFAQTLAGPLKDVHFDAVYTAEDIGSYKPDHRNFEYLLKGIDKGFGVQKGELLHVAQGVGADHVPAKKLGLWSAWIARNRPEGEEGYKGVGEEYEGKVGFQWRWSTLGAMAIDVEKAFGK